MKSRLLKRKGAVMTADMVKRGDSDNLRRRAEEMVREKAARLPEILETLSPEEARQSVHELRVHQIELEMQNEELRRAQAELDAARVRYFDLYNLAPVGYCTLSEKGLILEANLTAAILLGVARGDLVKWPLSRFVSLEDQDIYYRHRKLLVETGVPQVCELRLVKKDDTQFWARVEATVAQDGDGAPVCRTVMCDITARKQAEEALQKAHDELEHRVAARTKELRTEISERKQAQEALLESEFNIRNMANQLVDVLLATDNSGFVTFASPSSLQMFGWKPEEMVGISFIEFLPESEIPGAVAEFRDSLASGRKTQNLSFVMKRKDESTFQCELNRSVIWKDGRASGTVGIIRDITERKRAEEALRESEERYRNQVEGINDVAYSINSGGEITYISPVVKNVLGYEPEEMTNRHFLEFVHQEDLDLLKRKFAELREGVVGHDEYRVIGKSGDVKWVRTLTTPIMDIEGFTGGRGILMDMTERKQVEEALRRVEENFRRSLDDSPLGVRIVDEDGVTLYANRVILDIYGYDTLEELRTTPVEKRYTPKSYAEFRIRREKRQQGINVHSEYTISIVRKSGENRHLQVFRKGILWDGKRQFQVIYQDITERNKADVRGRVAREVLELLNRPQGFTDTVRDILQLIKKNTDFEAVGIRLREGNDFPYYETNGFSEAFIQAERYLCVSDEEGKILRDGQGNPVLECLCGNILCGRTNPTLPFFTGGGSFWSNCTTELLASTTEEDRQARARNRCNGEGYESVALIPLRTGDEIIGLLQLNDRRRNQFTPKMIRFFEGLGASIGIALLRKRGEEALVAESHQLAETNTALRVLLQRREVDQKETERKITANIQKLVLPNLEKLRTLKLNALQTTCLDIVDANLQQVISPFLQNIAARFADFTPREIQVANMIREGKTSKEIANFFSSSLRTVEFHRDNIRKKLGLSHKKSNLQALLMKLSEE